MRLDKNLLFVMMGIFFGATVGLVFFGVLSNRLRLPEPSEFAGARVMVGEEIQDFSLETLDGEDIHLAGQIGKAVVLNFWATWCGPCRIEMPILEDASVKYAGEVVFLAVNYDEPLEDVNAFVKELALTLPVLLDPGGEITDLLHIEAFPTTVFLDAQGVVRALHIGTLSEIQLTKYLQKIGVPR